MKTRNLVFIGAGIVLVSLTAFISKKKKDIEHIVNKLQFKLVSIRNPKISFKELALSLDIKAVNPTNENLYLNTGFITAKVLRVYEKKSKKLLAFSKLNTHKINIPSGGFYQLPPTHITIPLLTGGQLIVNGLINNKKDTIHTDFVKQLAFELDITALGKTQTIKF